MNNENDKQYEIVKFKLNDLEMDIFVSIEEETVWLTRRDISLLFQKDKTVISRHLKNVLNEDENTRNLVVSKNLLTDAKIALVRIEGGRKVTRFINVYNLDIILAIGHRVRSQNGILLKNFLEQYLKEYYNKVDNPIIIYDNGDISLPVNISPSENTVWLSKDQLEILFNSTRQNIEYHIENIYSQEELIESSTCKDFLQVQLEGDRKVTRISKMYNPDMIISLGYRINTNERHCIFFPET